LKLVGRRYVQVALGQSCNPIRRLITPIADGRFHIDDPASMPGPPKSRTFVHSDHRNGASAQPLRRPETRQQSGEPDVYISVPDLHVDEIRLDVDNLEAHLALQARLASLLELRAGAHVTVEKVELDIKGVAARAMLKVRLENVYAILDRALTSIDRNPRILEGVIDTLDDALGRGGVLGETIEGASRTVTSGARRGKLARVGAGVRSLRRAGHGDHRVTKVATAAGVLAGAALAAHSNGGIERTIKELTS
jgi:hypothetical protein